MLFAKYYPGKYKSPSAHIIWQSNESEKKVSEENLLRYASSISLLYYCPCYILTESSLTYVMSELMAQQEIVHKIDVDFQFCGHARHFESDFNSLIGGICNSNYEDFINDQLYLFNHFLAYAEDEGPFCNVEEVEEDFFVEKVAEAVEESRARPTI